MTSGLKYPSWRTTTRRRAYFAKFDDILKLKKHWSIRRQITLALLSFGKLLMYRDLDPEDVAGRPEYRQAPARARTVRRLKEPEYHSRRGVPDR